MSKTVRGIDAVRRIESVVHRVRGAAIDGPDVLVVTAKCRGGRCFTGTCGTRGGWGARARIVDRPISAYTAVLGRRRHDDLVIRVSNEGFDDRIDARGADAVVIGDEDAERHRRLLARLAATSKGRDKEAHSKEERRLKASGLDHACDTRNKPPHAQQGWGARIWADLG